MKRVSFVATVIIFMILGVSMQGKSENRQEGQKMQQDSVVEKLLLAKSIIGQKAPELVVEEWISKKPKTRGKFVLIEFWATTCGPCRDLIPELNEWQKKFKKDLVVIGISYEKAEKVKAMKKPVIEFYNGVDTKKTMSNELEIRGIPHTILIDPDGIVCWEGYLLWPVDQLTTEVLENKIREYKKKK